MAYDTDAAELLRENRNLKACIARVRELEAENERLQAEFKEGRTVNLVVKDCKPDGDGSFTALPQKPPANWSFEAARRLLGQELGATSASHRLTLELAVFGDDLPVNALKD